MKSATNFPRALIKGYESFKTKGLLTDMRRYQVLSEAGQAPETMLICCCDSRAAPETIFSAGPGELFVVRNVANLIPDFESDQSFHGTSAAIEFGVKGLKVKNIVVMGHGKCGGVNGFLADPAGVNESKTEFLTKWISLLKAPYDEVRSKRTIEDEESFTRLMKDNARVLMEVYFETDRVGFLGDISSAIGDAGYQIAKADIQAHCNKFVVDLSNNDWEGLNELKQKLKGIKGTTSVEFLLNPEHASVMQKELELQSVLKSIKNLDQFPFVKNLVDVGELNLYGAWFDIGTGQLMVHSDETKTWDYV